MKEKSKIFIDISPKLYALKDGFFSHNKEKTIWVPILRRNQTEDYIGILEDGRWVVESAQGLHVLNDPKQFFRIMDLLERPIKKIHHQIEIFFESFNITVDIDEFFPFIEIVNAGLEQRSEYWAALSFEWIPYISDEKKRFLLNSIANIIHAKWASQKLKQKAKKWVQQFEQV